MWITRPVFDLARSKRGVEPRPVLEWSGGCDRGTEKEVQVARLGQTKSCRCLRNEQMAAGLALAAGRARATVSLALAG